MSDGKIIYSTITSSYSIFEPCNPYHSVLQCLTSAMRSLQGLPKRDNECRRGRTSTIWDVNWKGEDLSDASIENRRNRWIKDKCQDTLEMWNFRPESRVHDSN